LANLSDGLKDQHLLHFDERLQSFESFEAGLALRFCGAFGGHFDFPLAVVLQREVSSSV